MQIIENVSLAQYSTMRLGGTARYAAEVSSRMDVETAVAWAVEHAVSILMIGTGSNVFWRDEGFDGLVLINRIGGYQDYAEDETNHYMTIAAGENWDKVVERSVLAGLTGIECLSLIPGTVGATPIQNVGAYGQEIADVLVSVEAYDLQSRSFITIPASDCSFGYRTSRFKAADRGRFLITGLTIHLLKQNPAPPFYRALSDYFSSRGIQQYSPLLVREAVITIRSQKLPDPAVIANNGSFFANPIITQAELVELQAIYPMLPQWPVDDNSGASKIPAAWLLEQAGFKDFHDSETGMATWPDQPLVFINEHARSTADLLQFKQKIVAAVQARFGIELEQEPEMLP